MKDTEHLIIYENENKNNKSYSSKQNYICLNMIVKDESKTIKRCLESLKDWCDFWIICDTGSKDDTKEIIINNLSGIPGVLLYEEFKDFSYNRNIVLSFTRKYLKTKDVSMEKVWVLFIDSDMILKAYKVSWKENLNQKSYKVLQKIGHLVYPNVRLVRSDVECKYLYPTHEYLALPLDVTSYNYTELCFIDLNDGGSKSNKFERDIKLIENYLKENDLDPRMNFYLAQTYWCIKQYEKAIIFYTKRILLGGWFEEIWYSYYRLVMCYIELKKIDEAFKYCYKSFEINPNRPEALFHLAEYFWKNNKHELSYSLSTMASLCSEASCEYGLFLEKDIFDYKIDFNFSISCYYLWKKQKNDKYLIQGINACEKLMNNDIVPKNVKSLTETNILFYLTYPIKHNEFIPYCLTKSPPTKFEKNHNFCNPTLLRLNDHTVLYNIRHVNYFFDIDHNKYIFEGSQIKTWNHMYKESTNEDMIIFHSHDIQPTVSSRIIKTDQNCSVLGFEDLRLFTVGNNIYAIGTSRFTNLNNSHINEIVLISLNHELSIEKVTRLKSPNILTCEKNWVPILNQKEILLLYKSCTVIKIDENNGDVSEVKSPHLKSNPDILNKFRGGSQVVPFRGGYIYIIHQVIINQNKRIYLHRFVELYDDLSYKRHSKLFYFNEKSVEFVCGLMIEDEEKGVLQVAYGVKDREAKFTKIIYNDIPF
jgi:tetratricopeptide (TPR) repeat protein